MSQETDLDELSGSWELESSNPGFRGVCSLIVSILLLILLISLIYKIIKLKKEQKQQYEQENHGLDVCKYCSICYEISRKQRINSNDFHNFCVLPAPLDVLICLFFFGFLCFLCNGYGILYYGSWVEASKWPIGSITIYVFAVLIGFCSLCSYLYFYSMLILTISKAGHDFIISIYIQRIHKIFMFMAAILLPIGNVIMEVFGQEYGRTFRFGQILAYIAFCCIFLGVTHLITLLIKRLQLLLINTLINDISISPKHLKSRTEIKNDINNLTQTQFQRDAHLLQVITKMLVILLIILIVSTGSGILTAFRYYFADNIHIATILSLIRWFWFTIINISFASFCVYLSVGFNINLYKFWCRCDKSVHKCIICCIKWKTIKKVTVTQNRVSTLSNNNATTPTTTTTTKEPIPAPPVMNKPVMNNTTKINQSVPSHSPSFPPSVDGKMTSYSSMNSSDNTEIIYDLKTKINDLANTANIELNTLKEKENVNHHHESQHTTDSISAVGYTPNAFNHMASEQL